MPNMSIVVYGWAARVHANFASVEGLELSDGFSECIIELHVYGLVIIG